jgi:hypothetical protein
MAIFHNWVRIELGSAMWGPGKFQKYIPEEFKTLVEQIFNDPEIAGALNN